MAEDKQLCVDIILLGTPHEEIFVNLSRKIHERRFYSSGIHRHESESKTRLEGQERALFTGIAEEYIRGRIIGVDGILTDGINVSTNVDNNEANRIKLDFNRFRVKTEVNI